MTDTLDNLDNLILDLLEWLGSSQRPYLEVLDAWRTSCPRFPVWEDANDRGFIERHYSPGRAANTFRCRWPEPNTFGNTAPSRSPMSNHSASDRLGAPQIPSSCRAERRLARFRNGTLAFECISDEWPGRLAG